MLYNLHESIGYQLTLLSRANERNIELVLKEYNLTRITWVTLIAVGVNSLSQPSRIAEFLGVERPIVSRALTALEKLGHIERLNSGTDARRVMVQVTRKGQELLTGAVPKVRNCNEELVASLSDENRIILGQLLKQMNASIPSVPNI